MIKRLIENAGLRARYALMWQHVRVVQSTKRLNDGLVENRGQAVINWLAEDSFGQVARKGT